nr:hypothetical protein [Tanacetum cinerariifolium]
YDTDRSTEVHENCDDNEIFNMFTQEDQHTELLEPIPESHQVPQNDNDLASEDTNVEQAKFIGDFKSLANEADTSLAKHKALELEIKRLLKAVLMNDLKRNKHFPEKIASNLKFLNNLQPEWSRHVTIVHQTKDLQTTDYTQLYDFLKYNQKEVDELKAKRIAKIQYPLALMANSNNPYAFSVPHQDQSSFNPNYLQQPMPNPEDITDPTTTMNMALALMAKAFKLNYSTPTNNNQRISSNPKNRQIAQPGQNAGNPAGYNDVIRNQVIQNAVQNPRVQNVRNQNGLIGVQRSGNQNSIRNGNLVVARAKGNAAGQNGNQIRCYNCRGVGHYARNCTVRPKKRDAAYLQTQLLIAQKEEAGIQLQAEEYDLMVAAADLDDIKEVNANCILMANLQQASTSGTQTDSAPVYDTDRSAEVHENYDDNEIFNMFTQEEQYTELLEPIPESHQVPQNDNDVISEDTSVEQGGETVEQHLENFKETRAFYESLYHNLAIEVEKVNSEEVGIQLQAEEFDLIVAAADLDEIKEVNANCILMANLQQASTSGTQTDKAPVYDSDGSAEAYNYENCYDDEIFNMFTQEEQYTELLEPIPEPHQVPQNDNNVIYKNSSVEQSGATVEQHPTNVEEIRVLYDSLYNNLAIEVEKVSTVNRKLKETNVELTTELARFKNLEKCFEISQEKYDKLERCY